MNDINENLDRLVKRLQQERDELRLKLHLAKEDLADEWEKVEAKLSKLESKTKEVGSVAADVAKDVGAAAKLLAEEVGKGLEKIRRRL